MFAAFSRQITCGTGARALRAATSLQPRAFPANVPRTGVPHGLAGKNVRVISTQAVELLHKQRPSEFTDDVKVLRREDLISLKEYDSVRRSLRQQRLDIKQDRRIEIGPHSAVHFENYDLMWMQVQEMLYIECGPLGTQEAFDAQATDELLAYNPLLPIGHDVVATLFFEINNKIIRERFLSVAGGADECVFLEFPDDKGTMQKLYASPIVEEGIDRTQESGRTSAVHFLRFTFDDKNLRRDFLQAAPGTVSAGLDHANYAHLTRLQANVLASLQGDLSE